MAQFYLDEDFQVGVASLLERAGHSAITTPQASNLRAWDVEQLLFAVGAGRTLLTHNRRDFRTLHDAWTRWSPRWRQPEPHAGILILDQGHSLRAVHYVAAIHTFLDNAPESLANLTFDWFARTNIWTPWRP